MKRQFNYTGRRRIFQTDVAVRVTRTPQQERTFEASFDLAEYGFPPEAHVYIEAYYKRTYMRFDFGTVGAIQEPNDRTLGDIESGDQVFFNLLVVDEAGEHGKILAAADGLTAMDAAVTESGRRPILPVNHSDELGDLIWRVRFDDIQGPILEVNNQVPGIREIVRTNRTFFSLVYPSVLREVLDRILLVDEEDVDDTDANSWQGRWLSYVRGFYLSSPPPRQALEQREEWIEEAVGAFASRFVVRSKYIEDLQITG